MLGEELMGLVLVTLTLDVCNSCKREVKKAERLDNLEQEERS